MQIIGSNSSVLRPFELPSSSLSSNRLKNVNNSKILKDVRRGAPRVLAETKRRVIKDSSFLNETHRVKGDVAFSTPQRNNNQYETLKSKNCNNFYSQGKVSNS